MAHCKTTRIGYTVKLSKNSSDYGADSWSLLHFTQCTAAAHRLNVAWGRTLPTCNNRKLLCQPLTVCRSLVGGITRWYSHRARRMMLIMCSRSSTTAPPSSISSGQVPATLPRIARPSRHHGLHAESLRLLLSLPSRLKLPPDGRMATVDFRRACIVGAAKDGNQSCLLQPYQQHSGQKL